ncbi:hypothetical protein G7Y79_00015g038220 [Physcia stellaris]|nr:hypothetical protein G7Y79_00015g038220 [Physcia stellaris]
MTPAPTPLSPSPDPTPNSTTHTQPPQTPPNRTPLHPNPRLHPNLPRNQHPPDSPPLPPQSSTQIISVFTAWEPAFQTALTTLYHALDVYLGECYPGITPAAKRNRAAGWRLDCRDRDEGVGGGGNEGEGMGEGEGEAWVRRLSHAGHEVEFMVQVTAWVPVGRAGEGKGMWQGGR